MTSRSLVDARVTIAKVAKQVVALTESRPSELLREEWAVLDPLIRTTDGLIERLAPGAEVDPEAGVLLMLARALRRLLFLVMAEVNPDQAWFWTEEWQAGEREADADIAAGRTTFHASSEEFLAALESRAVDANP